MFRRYETVQLDDGTKAMCVFQIQKRNNYLFVNVDYMEEFEFLLCHKFNVESEKKIANYLCCYMKYTLLSKEHQTFVKRCLEENIFLFVKFDHKRCFGREYRISNELKKTGKFSTTLFYKYVYKNTFFYKYLPTYDMFELSQYMMLTDEQVLFALTSIMMHLHNLLNCNKMDTDIKLENILYDGSFLYFIDLEGLEDIDEEKKINLRVLTPFSTDQEFLKEEFRLNESTYAEYFATRLVSRIIKDLLHTVTNSTLKERLRNLNKKYEKKISSFSGLLIDISSLYYGSKKLSNIQRSLVL